MRIGGISSSELRDWYFSPSCLGIGGIVWEVQQLVVFPAQALVASFHLLFLALVA